MLGQILSQKVFVTDFVLDLCVIQKVVSCILIICDRLFELLKTATNTICDGFTCDTNSSVTFDFRDFICVNPTPSQILFVTEFYILSPQILPKSSQIIFVTEIYIVTINHYFSITSDMY